MACLDAITHSPSAAVDLLQKISHAFDAFAELLRPTDDRGYVDREQLAMLLTLIDEATPDATLVHHARIAVVDLLGSRRGLDCLAREHLYALVHVLAQCQHGALKQLRLAAGLAGRGG